MRRRKAFGLVAMVLLTGMIAMASLLVLDYALQARQRVARAAFELQAKAMARSGLRYAEAMVRHGRWRTATTYASPALGHGERFTVTARPVGGGWELESVGEVGTVTHRERERL